MKRMIRRAICAVVLAALMTGAALAAGVSTPECTEGVIDGAALVKTGEGVYTASCFNVTANREYLILVVTKEEDVTALGGETGVSTIQYIDQRNSGDSTTITFTVRPRTGRACDVYLCGEDFSGPLRLGVICRTGDGPGLRVGDVDGNGRVNLKDGALLTRYAMKMPGIAIDTEAADIDADGKVGLKDAALLTRYAMGMPGSSAFFVQ